MRLILHAQFVPLSEPAANCSRVERWINVEGFGNSSLTIGAPD